MCPQWDSWSILTKEGLMEVGHIQPNGTRQERNTDCVPPPSIRRETYCMVQLVALKMGYSVGEEFQTWGTWQ